VFHLGENNGYLEEINTEKKNHEVSHVQLQTSSFQLLKKKSNWFIFLTVFKKNFQIIFLNFILKIETKITPFSLDNKMVKQTNTFTVLSEPKNSSLEKPYHPRAKETDDIDFLATFALICGLIGTTMKLKLFSWLGLFCSISSIINTKTSEYETKSTYTYLIFSFMSLVMNYFGPTVVPKT
jgi:hypothetical protein